jgi:hypothetical protein
LQKNNLPFGSYWNAIRVGFVAGCLLYNMPQAVLTIIKSVSMTSSSICLSVTDVLHQVYISYDIYKEGRA